jgi:hypothetical protein
MAAILPGSLAELGFGIAATWRHQTVFGKSSASFTVAFMRRRVPRLNLIRTTPVQFAPGARAKPHPIRNL